MKAICFICNKYPNQEDKNGLVFVQQLVWALADMGQECTVVCPLAVNLYPSLRRIPYHVIENTSKGNKVNVFFPKYFGFGQSYHIFGKSPAFLTTHLFTKTVRKTILDNKISFDAVYGHFITPAAIAAARIGREMNIPSFLAYGESSSWSIDQIGKDKVQKELRSLSGVIAVSSHSKNILIGSNCVRNEIIEVFPNGYHKDRFKPIDRSLARDKMGWPQDAYIVGFVGSFDKRKGVLRLQEAVDLLHDVKFACAGKGPLVPKSVNCILSRPVNHEELLYFYNAIDVFVLPTLNEGCCNAIIEALACGCPIISSNLSFNDDILNDDCSIRVDPTNITDIAKSIESIHFDVSKREKMKRASLEKAKELTLESRAQNICYFMEKIVNQF